MPDKRGRTGRTPWHRPIPRRRETPLAAWKRPDLAGDGISEADKARVAPEGRLEVPDHEAMVARGEA